MEDYRHHILDTKELNLSKQHKSLCGKLISMEFHYVDVDHAMNTRRTGSRLLVCQTCAVIVNAALTNQG